MPKWRSQPTILADVIAIAIGSIQYRRLSMPILATATYIISMVSNSL